MHERGADVVEPAQRIERDIACVADHDETLDAGARAVEAACLAFGADAVLDNQMCAIDADLDPEAAGHDNATLGDASLVAHRN